MTLLEPIWLLLALPLAVILRRWRQRGTRRLLRLALIAVVLLGLARPSLLLPRKAGNVAVLVDRSASMPDASGAGGGIEAVGLETVGRLLASRSGEQGVAVVSFGDRPVVERLPGGGDFTGFLGEVGEHRSDLAEALDTALSLLPADAPGRILLLSDARLTGTDALPAVARAAARGVPIDHRLVERASTQDLAITSIDAPDEVSPGEGFLISTWLRSPISQRIDYELRRGRVVVAKGQRTVTPGRNRLVFRDRAEGPGSLAYELVLSGEAGEDPVPENDSARFLVNARGPKPILRLTRGVDGGLGELLRASGLDVISREPTLLSLSELGGASAVILENVTADALGPATLATLAGWIRDAGGGLLLTGGRRSFALGGYYRSPLDPVLPVSMELRREHRKLAVALAVTMDRSGSMSLPVPGGRTKMDLANLAAAEVLDLLSPMDEIAVIAVDSAPHEVVPLTSAGEVSSIRQRILSIESMGGGIYVYEALAAAASELAKSQAGARHILLFADAADAENPASYKTLLERCRAAGITVSVVGLGTENDPDAALLKDIAKRGEGRSFFTANAAQLPRIFAQDTFSVVRSAFLEEVTPLRLTSSFGAYLGTRLDSPKPLGGYNLTYARPEAEVLAVTEDEYKAPVLAGWRVGLGRVLTHTGEADGDFTGDFATWPAVGEYFSSLTRWAAGAQSALPRGLLATQDLEDGVVRVRLHLDPEDTRHAFDQLPEVRFLRGPAGEPPRSERATLEWQDAHTLVADLELSGDEIALATVDVPDSGAVTLAPVRLPYSPEFQPATPGEGAERLQRYSQATGGRGVIDVAGLWKTFPRAPRFVELTPFLFVLALAFFLLEILERRTGLVSMALAAKKRPGSASRTLFQRLKLPTLRRPRPRTEKATPPPKPSPSSAPAAAKPKSRDPRPESAPTPEPDAAASPLEQALGKARAKADRRTRR